MARLLTYGNYGVYVFRERGQPHHLPHAHIKFRGRKVASVFLLTLAFFDQVERVPSGLVDYIAANQDMLLDGWENLNRE